MKKDIRKLTINPINPRKISTEMRRRLQQSIMLFPRMLYFRDIIVNEDGVVLAGKPAHVDTQRDTEHHAP